MAETSLNDIAAVQNAEPQLRLLRARRQMYRHGKRLLALQIFLTVCIPVVGSLLTLKWLELKAWVAFAALVIAVLDATIFDRLQRKIRIDAAKAQEQFDCVVLQLPWDDFTVGPRLTPETVRAAETKYGSGKGDTPVADWYPPAVSQLPIHLARIVCQRTNIWYDAKVRRWYGTAAIDLTVALSLVFIAISLGEGLTVETLVLSVLAPAAPVLIWGLREWFRQRDTADGLERLRSEAEKLWQRAISGACSEQQCTIESRQYQNAIFDRRSNSPLIFSWIYKIKRSALEDQMNWGAEHFVAEALAAQNKKA